MLLTLAEKLGLEPENTMTSFKHSLALFIATGMSLIPIQAADPAPILKKEPPSMGGRSCLAEGSARLVCETKTPPVRGIRSCLAWFASKMPACCCCAASRSAPTACLREPGAAAKPSGSPQGTEAVPTKSYR